MLHSSQYSGLILTSVRLVTRRRALTKNQRQSFSEHIVLAEAIRVRQHHVKLKL